MATTIQQFAKSKGVRIHQAKTIIKTILGEVPDMLSDDDLVSIENGQKSTTDSPKQLAASVEENEQEPTEPMQEPTPQPESTAITTESENYDLSNSLPETEESVVSDLALSLSRANHVEALIEGKLITHEKKISLLIQDSQVRLSNKLDAHFNFVETTVMNSIKQDLADISAHNPVQAAKPKTKTSRDEMLELLSTAGLEIKS